MSLDIMGYIPYNRDMIERTRVPNISNFNGITLYEYPFVAEHNPPHIHAKYGEYRATFLIETGECRDGAFPFKQRKLVKKFIKQYKTELMEMWETNIINKLPREK